MHHYWERNKKSNKDHSMVSKTAEIKKTEKLPEINSFIKDNRIAAYIKIKEKEK